MIRNAHVLILLFAAQFSSAQMKVMNLGGAKPVVQSTAAPAPVVQSAPQAPQVAAPTPQAAPRVSSPPVISREQVTSRRSNSSSDDEAIAEAARLGNGKGSGYAEGRYEPVCKTCRNRGAQRIVGWTGSNTIFHWTQIRFAHTHREYGEGPIRRAFAQKFAECAPGCQPIRGNIWRETWQGSFARSCHYVGRAVDLFGLDCPAGDFMARNNGPEFKEFLRCMEQDLPVMFRNRDPNQIVCRNRRGYGQVCGPLGITEAHYDHAHIGGASCHQH